MSAQKKNRIVRVLYFSFLILPILILIGVVQQSFEQLKSMEQLRLHKKNFQHALIQAARGVVINNKSEFPINNYSKDELGDFVELLPLVENIALNYHKMGCELTETLKSLEGMLKIDVITNDVEILRSKEKVKLVLERLTDFKQRVSLAKAQGKSAIEATNCDGRYKAVALQLFDQELEKSSLRYEEFIRVEKSIASLVDTILTFFSDRKGLFWEFNGHVVFERNSDLEQCNLFVQRLRELSVEENEVRRPLFQSAQAFSETLASPSL